MKNELKKDNKIAYFGSMKLIDSRDDKNFSVVTLLRHSAEAMHALTNTENKHSAGEETAQ